MMNGKREPIGWMGPSGQKSHWRVIDSRGQRIASGFTTRALALRWIDGLNLLRAGYQISDDDHEWIFSHWHSALPARQDPGFTLRLSPAVTQTCRPLPLRMRAEPKAQAVAGDNRKQKVRATLRPLRPATTEDGQSPER